MKPCLAKCLVAAIAAGAAAAVGAVSLDLGIVLALAAYSLVGMATLFSAALMLAADEPRAASAPAQGHASRAWA